MNIKLCLEIWTQLLQTRASDQAAILKS